MAKILLNVELNAATAEQEAAALAKKIKASFDSSVTGTGAVSSVNNLQKGFANLLNTIKSSERQYNPGLFTNLKTQTAAYLEEIKKLNAAIGDNEPTTNQALRLRELAKALSDTSTQFATVRAESDKLTKTLKVGEKSVIEMAQGFVKWQAAATIVMTAVNLVRGYFSDLNETLTTTENKIIELRRVMTDEDKSAYSNKTMSDALYDIAIKYGQDFETVADMAAAFEKAGYSWADSLKAVESASLALNVAELDSEEATDGLISIMKQFGYEASELTNIIDILNKTADNAPVTTEKLLQALQKTGSYASQANMSLEETVGIITALSGATNASGQQLGTAVKSLLAYTTKSKSLDVYAGLSSNMEAIVADYRKGAASILDVWQGLSKELKSLSKEQADNLAEYAESELGQEMESALGEELSEIYDDMTGVYDTAGTYRKNYFIALMKNFDDVQAALETMNDAYGYSAEENITAMEAYEKKVESLNAQWGKYLSSATQVNDIKKGLADLANGLLSVLTYLGGARTTLALIVPLAVAAFGPKVLSMIKELGAALKGATTAAQAFQSTISWIGVALAALSIAVSIYETEVQKMHDANQQAISDWEEMAEDAKNLRELYSKYLELDSAADEYKSTEEAIVKLLSDDKVEALKTLTEGTDKYREAVEKLTEAELKEAAEAYLVSQKSAEEEMAAAGLTDFYINSGEYEVATALGLPTTSTTNWDTGLQTYYATGFENTNTAAGNYNNYLLLKQYAEKLYDEYNAAVLRGESQEYINSVYSLYEKYYNRYKNAKSTADTYQQYYDVAGGKATPISFDDYLSGLKGKTSDDEGSGSTTETALGNVISKLKEWKSLQEEINDYTEKQKDLLEAEAALEQEKNEAEEEIAERKLALAEKELTLEEKLKALRDAENERTTRVFNAETGQWEWTYDYKKVTSAQEAVATAQNAVVEAEKSLTEQLIKNADAIADAEQKIEEAKRALEAEAYGDILAYLEGLKEGETPDEEHIKALWEKWMLGEINGETPYSGESSSLSALLKLLGIKVTAGVDDEDYELDGHTKKVLLDIMPNQSPAYYKNLGLLFGTPVAGDALAATLNNNSSSVDDHRSYNINGVPITSVMAQTMTIEQLFEALPLVQ